MTDQDLAYRFIEATESIKSALERTYRMEFTGMKEAVRHARDKGHPVVRAHRRPLNVAGDLRNAMQHAGYLDGQPLATPREDVVMKIEKIADGIEHPSQVKDHMVKNVAVLAPDTPSKLRPAMLRTPTFPNFPSIKAPPTWVFSPPMR